MLFFRRFDGHHAFPILGGKLPRDFPIPPLQHTTRNRGSRPLAEKNSKKFFVFKNSTHYTIVNNNTIIYIIMTRQYYI